MRISAVSTFKQNNDLTAKKNYSGSVQSPISFGDFGYNIDHCPKTITRYAKQKFSRILERSSSEMEELGEYFHKSSNDDIKAGAEILNFFGFTKTDESNRAYRKLLSAVESVRRKKELLVERISVLSKKEALGESNVAAEKDNITKLFIDLLKGEKKGMDVPITNGILISGTSKEKKPFLDWIMNNAPVNFKEMQFNINKPQESLDELFNIAKNSKLLYETNQKRTLLHVEGLDNLLTNFDDISGRRFIGKFNGFAENLSNDYCTTIATITDRNSDDFESASIAPHRFGLKINLKEGIEPAEKTELANARAVVSKMDKQAEKVGEKCFYWRYS